MQQPRRCKVVLHCTQMHNSAASHAHTVAQQVQPVNEAASAANSQISDNVWDAYKGLCNNP